MRVEYLSRVYTSSDVKILEKFVLRDGEVERFIIKQTSRVGRKEMELTEEEREVAIDMYELERESGSMVALGLVSDVEELRGMFLVLLYHKVEFKTREEMEEACSRGKLEWEVTDERCGYDIPKEEFGRALSEYRERVAN